MENNSVPKFIFRFSRFPVYRGSVFGRFYCINVCTATVMTEPVLHYSNPACNKNPLRDNTWKTDLYNNVRKSSNLLISVAVNALNPVHRPPYEDPLHPHCEYRD